jgi:hypothetical protein
VLLVLREIDCTEPGLAVQACNLSLPRWLSPVESMMYILRRRVEHTGTRLTFPISHQVLSVLQSTRSYVNPIRKTVVLSATERKKVLLTVLCRSRFSPLDRMY